MVYKVKITVNKKNNGEIDSTYKDIKKAESRANEFNKTCQKSSNKRAFVDTMTSYEIEKYGFDWNRNSKKKVYANQQQGTVRNND